MSIITMQTRIRFKFKWRSSPPAAASAKRGTQEKSLRKPYKKKNINSRWWSLLCFFFWQFDNLLILLINKENTYRFYLLYALAPLYYIEPVFCLCIIFQLHFSRRTVGLFFGNRRQKSVTKLSKLLKSAVFVSDV